MKAARYFEQRALHSVFLLTAISVLAFALTQLAPGSFLDELRLNPQISPQTIEALRTQYALDQPVAVRYYRWVKSMTRGDFGYSMSYNTPVNALLWQRLRNTLLLGLAAMLAAWLLALPMGMWSARKAGHWFDRLCVWLSTLLLGTPELVLALLFVLLAAHFGTLPTGGMTSTTDGSRRKIAGDVLRHLIIPTAALALASFPLLFRHIRAAMLEAWNSPFVHAAKGHGIGETRLLLRHALPAALQSADLVVWPLPRHISQRLLFGRSRHWMAGTGTAIS